MRHLISAPELHDALESETDIRLLDVRWRLDAPDGRPAYLAGHVPGAVYVALDDELSDHTREGLGRHPLPSHEGLEAAARRWGVELDTPIVAYDDAMGTAAARAWWVLRAFGFSDVRVLDGGWRAWTQSGGAIETEEPTIRPSAVSIAPLADAGLTADEAAAMPARGRLIDARAADRYTGEHEVVDSRAGHIPGAVSLPTTGNVDAHGRFLPPEEIRARFAAVGALDAEVGVYCGSGIAATHTILALELAGGTGRLFPGSFSQWASDPTRPVTMGPDPDGRMLGAPPPPQA